MPWYTFFLPTKTGKHNTRDHLSSLNILYSDHFNPMTETINSIRNLTEYSYELLNKYSLHKQENWKCIVNDIYHVYQTLDNTFIHGWGVQSTMGCMCSFICSLYNMLSVEVVFAMLCYAAMLSSDLKSEYKVF